MLSPRAGLNVGKNMKDAGDIKDALKAWGPSTGLNVKNGAAFVLPNQGPTSKKTVRACTATAVLVTLTPCA